MVKICVVGAGVMGLSAAVRIQDRYAESDITLISDKFSPNTTSDGAGALFIIYFMAGNPVELIYRWSRETLQHLNSLAMSQEAGDARVQFVSGYSLGDSEEIVHPDLPSRDLTEEEKKMLPYASWGRFFTSLIVDCTSYLPWLLKRFTDRKGKVIKKKVESLTELYDSYDIVINCTGLSSSQLAHDPEVIPAKGETIRVHAPWVKHFYIQNIGGEITYILPGSKNVVLGGSYEKGNWDVSSNEKTRATILERCYNILPSLKSAAVDFNWAGIRPTRSPVRLELEPMTPFRKCRVIHNYGHGGSGVTLHWGCAGDVVQLVDDAILSLKTTSKL